MIVRRRFSIREKEQIAYYRHQFDPTSVMEKRVICPRCHKSIPLEVMEVDHIKPVSKGEGITRTILDFYVPVAIKKSMQSIGKVKGKV